MYRGIGARLEQIRIEGNAGLTEMAQHALTHRHAQPPDLDVFPEPHSMQVTPYLIALRGVEAAPKPQPVWAAWHASIRLCVSMVGTYPWWYSHEQIVQPYNDSDDDRLLAAARRHKRRADWWWRINTWPRAKGSWCLLCNLPLHDGSPYRHGDLTVPLRILQHRAAHIWTLDSGAYTGNWYDMRRWRTPELTEGQH